MLRAKMSVEEGRNNRQSVIVDELPYGIIRKSIVEAVAEAVKKGLINDISAINDESGRQHKVRIVVDLKRDADPQLVINQLYSTLRARYGEHDQHRVVNRRRADGMRS